MMRSMTVDDLPTKICPECGERVDQRRRKCCPYCDTHIDLMYVPNRGPHSEGTGKTRAIYVWEKGRVSDLVKLMQGYIRTEIGNREWLVADWGRECGQANLLLAYCKGEGPLAEQVIRAHFDPEIRDRLGIRRSVRSMAQMVGVYSDINKVLNWAVQEYGKQRAASVQQLGFSYATE